MSLTDLSDDIQQKIMQTGIVDVRRSMDDVEERMGQEARNITHARHQLQIAQMNPFTAGLAVQLHRQTINQATNRFNNLREQRNTLHNTLGNMRVLARNLAILPQDQQ